MAPTLLPVGVHDANAEGRRFYADDAEVLRAPEREQRPGAKRVVEQPGEPLFDANYPERSYARLDVVP